MKKWLGLLMVLIVGIVGNILFYVYGLENYLYALGVAMGYIMCVVVYESKIKGEIE